MAVCLLPISEIIEMAEMLSSVIKKLPPLLVNQIAAGEVIERPASVVKELLENSIDAGSTIIDIDIEGGGKQLIRLRDNGCGIAKHELILAVSSHATSKIACIDDLSCINTLGFRGEALASICSISHLQLTSNTSEQQQAWVLLCDGRDSDYQCQPAQHPAGTTIEVRDLFFNTPARRRFLRTNKTEFDHIEEIVKRIALSHFNIALHLRHDGKTIFRVPAGTDIANQEKRVAKLFGSAFLQNALFIDTEITGLHVSGWVSQPAYGRNSAELQYFFINGRMVKDKLLAHAVRQSYHEHLYAGKHPSYLLYLHIDATEVDVNVHPTKHEVRFQEGRLVHDFIARSIEQSLTTPVTSSAIDTPLPPSVEKIAVIDYSHVDKPAAIYKMPMHYAIPVARTPTQSYKITRDNSIIGIWKNNYLLFENQQQLMIISIAKAWQQLLREKLIEQWRQNAIKTKPLLLPITINLQQTSSTIEQHFDGLQSLGILCESLTASSVIIREVPVCLSRLQIETALQQLFAALKNNILSAENSIDYLITENTIDLSACQDNESLQQLIDYWRSRGDNVSSLTYVLELSTLEKFFL